MLQLPMDIFGNNQLVFKALVLIRRVADTVMHRPSETLGFKTVVSATTCKELGEEEVERGLRRRPPGPQECLHCETSSATYLTLSPGLKLDLRLMRPTAMSDLEVIFCLLYCVRHQSTKKLVPVPALHSMDHWQ
jgi:hypothetical protein